MNFYSPFAQPVDSNLHNPFKTRLVALGLGAVDEAPTVFDFYVDSVNGSDANNGLTELTPKQTIAAAQALMSSGKSLGFARGSYWRETFEFTANNQTIGPYGTGAAPILDGADVIANTWTQPNAGTYPDVWQVSWTRAQAVPTSNVVYLSLWINGEHPTRFATSFADLQTNGGFWIDGVINLTYQNSTIYIKSTVDPNSDGNVYEAQYRSYCIAGHQNATGNLEINQQIWGPIELKRAGEHLNAFAGGNGEARRLLVRDGNVHNGVTEGSLTEDCIAAEVATSSNGQASLLVAYKSSGVGFSHTFRRCLGLLPGGASRNVNNSSFYMHAGTQAQSLTLDQCMTRGTSFASGDVLSMTVTNGFAEDVVDYVASLGATTTAVEITRMFAVNYTLGSLFIRRLASVMSCVVTDCASYKLSGADITDAAGGTRMQITNCSLVYDGTTSGGGYTGGNPVCNYNVLITSDIPLTVPGTTYTGNFNVFRKKTNNTPRFFYNGVLRGDLATWQSVTGQDASSVILYLADQTAGNANAFWLGVANNTGGPAVGDFRINPSARVYNSAGTAFIGTFADGTTPLTLAGPQTHWNFNTRSVASGPPTRAPVMPTTIAECRTYLEDPTAWDFYP